MNISQESLVKLLKKSKAELYYLGNGRGKGYQIDESELERVLNGFKVVEPSPKTKVKKFNKFNLPTKELLAQLTK